MTVDTGLMIFWVIIEIGKEEEWGVGRGESRREGELEAGEENPSDSRREVSHRSTGLPQPMQPGWPEGAGSSWCRSVPRESASVSGAAADGRGSYMLLPKAELFL